MTLFTSVDRLREESGSGEYTTLSTEDDLVEEWDGNADDIELADPDMIHDED